MKKTILLLVAFLSPVIFLTADDGSNLGLGSEKAGSSFEGIVTATGPTADDPEHTFTAISDDGLAKVFRISSLKDLDVGDRVSVQYVESETYPLEVKSIRFHESSDAK